MEKFIWSFLIAIYFSVDTAGQSQVDTSRLRIDLIQITSTHEFRNAHSIKGLDQVADYIQSEFLQSTPHVVIQEFRAGGNRYKNIIASFDTTHSHRIVVGAHYDVCGNQQGADDNASGVAGLLALARMLKNEKLPYRIDLVAYSLEEPPYFRSASMGSFIHAKYLHENAIPVKGMISLEMIGYYSNEKNSQRYPLGILKLIYGSKGNFITVVRKLGSGRFARQLNRSMMRQRWIRSKSFKGPASLPGIDFSDHLNYWKFGFSAVMITDTAFYRNPNYHLPTDTIETLDLHRMSLAIQAIYESLQQTQ